MDKNDIGRKHRHRMSAKQVQWLKKNARSGTARQTTERFNKQFSTTLSHQAIKAHCQCRSIGMGRSWAAYADAEKCWLATHASEHTKETLAQAFNTRFNTNRGAGTLAEKARELGAKCKPDPKAKRSFSEGEARWITHNAHAHDADRLAEAFNAQFATSTSTSTIREKCNRLGVRPRTHEGHSAKTGPAGRWRYSAAHEQWLKDNAGKESWETIRARFERTFGAAPKARSIMVKCRALKIRKLHPGQIAITAAHIRWLDIHAPGTTTATLAAQFNERFSESIGADRVRVLANRYGVRTGRNRYPFGPTEDEWLDRTCGSFEYDELRTAFNQEFGAQVTRKALEKRMQAAWLPRAQERGQLPRVQRNRNRLAAQQRRTQRSRHAARRVLQTLSQGVALRNLGPMPKARDRNPKRTVTISIGRESEKLWLTTKAPGATVDVVTRKFNEKFGANIGSETIRRKCHELGTSCLERYHRYTDEEKEWIRANTTALTGSESARQFNTRFGTRIKAGAMLKACQEFGAKVRHKRIRRTTPRYATRLKTPRRTWDREGVQQVCTLYKAGRTLAAIGHTLGLTPKQTDRAVKAANTARTGRTKGETPTVER